MSTIITLKRTTKQECHHKLKKTIETFAIKNDKLTAKGDKRAKEGNKRFVDCNTRLIGNFLNG
jgi:hypothetical protein